MKKIIIFLFATFLALNVTSTSIAQATTKQFSDVPSDYPGKRDIDYLVSLNIINGYQNGSFKPENTITNSQSAIMVARALKVDLSNRPNPNFGDVFSQTSGFKEISALADEGILPQSQNFYPNAPISRESMARILVNAFSLKGTQIFSFNDVQTNGWSYPYINALASNNITIGYSDGSFKPKAPVTRAHFSSFMARALNPAFRPKPISQVQAVTRGINFNMTMSQVEKKETAKLLHKETDGHIGMLEYAVSKYNYSTNIQYLFDNGKLTYIIYDFLPNQDAYHTWNEMSYLHDRLHNAAIKELGNNFFFYSDDISTLITSWDKTGYSALLKVDDENLYTRARLIYYAN